MLARVGVLRRALASLAGRTASPAEQLARLDDGSADAASPFERLDASRFGKDQFVLHVRYTRFTVAVALALASALVLVALGAAGLWGQMYFVLPFASLAVSCGAAWTFKDVREYWIDGLRRQYRFRVGSAAPFVGPIHNIYIRMRKRVGRGDEEPQWYLVLSGSQVEKHVISGASADIHTVRDLGQRLAATLGINYFDEPNISPYPLNKAYV
eukprot:m51a1_g9688 hypothetical protein (212) ;mRNA; r:1330270-1331260